MDRVVTVEEMQAIEHDLFKRDKFSESLIIETVGINSTFAISDLIQEYEIDSVLILIGKGNNAADALAMGRHLKNKGLAVEAWKTIKGEVSPELQKQIGYLRSFDIPLYEQRSPEDLANRPKARWMIIDGILGTGFVPPLSDELKTWVEVLNSIDEQVVSVDIPSGINGTTGAGDFFVHANRTLSVEFMKTGHLQNSGLAACGELMVVDGGFPAAVHNEGTLWFYPINSLRLPFCHHDDCTHKYQRGSVLIAGGSKGMCGALLLSSSSCVHFGAGLVKAVTWKESYKELATQKEISMMAGEIDPELDLSSYRSILVGPGLGKNSKAENFVNRVLKEATGTVVLDADAIGIANLEFAKARSEATVLTPHTGEFLKLCERYEVEVKDDLLKAARELAKRFQLQIILKNSAATFVISSDETGICYHPNPALSKGGSGDVLAGIVVAVTSQIVKADHISLHQGLISAVLTHQVAGELAKEDQGELSVTADQLIGYLSKAYRYLVEGEKSE